MVPDAGPNDFQGEYEMLLAKFNGGMTVTVIPALETAFINAVSLYGAPVAFECNGKEYVSIGPGALRPESSVIVCWSNRGWFDATMCGRDSWTDFQNEEVTMVKFSGVNYLPRN